MKRLVSALPAVLLAACVAGPDYRVPSGAFAERSEANAPFLGQTDAGATQQPLPPHWWRLYDDARLDAYVEEALAANTDLRAAQANLERATAVVREAQASASVRTGLNGQALVARVAGPDAGLPSRFSYSLGFDLDYPLDLAGSIRRGIEAASAQAEAAVAARNEVRVSVAAAVARSYAHVCSAKLGLDAARRVAAIQQSTLDVAIRMGREGRGTRFDIDRARAAVHASTAALPQIIAERQSALLELAALMGRVPADLPLDAQTCGTIPALRQALPAGDGAMLIRRRPDIRNAERQLAAATAMIGVEEAELYPRVSFGASAGTAAPLGRLLSPSSFGASIGPLITWTFPNRRAVRARGDQASADADAALARFDGAVLLALRQVETALSSYARARDNLRELKRAAAAAAEASDDAATLQRFGRTPFLDVLNAQARYADAQASLSLARASFIDREIDLFLVLGGGWE
jgi:NodT family efflux transporter outer membrane factor (OMF) lipoprotein